MATRSRLVARVVELVGSKLFRNVDPQDGWPALADIRVNGDVVPVAMFVAPVTLTHRERDEVERRIQNPGQKRPIVLPPHRVPLLLGLWENDERLTVTRPVLMSADPVRREGLQTRYSVFASLHCLKRASAVGWSDDESTSGEAIRCFHPALLPTYIELVRADVAVASEAIALTFLASGLADEAPEAPEDRARRATTSLVRDARFGKAVVEAYGGLCAMCGLNLGLIQGAHIYPASAPRSPDEVWNGVALCGNHHAAFDRHYIWVEPTTRAITLHSDLHRFKQRSEACRNFVDSTFGELDVPKKREFIPKKSMFLKRYDHFGENYDWVS